MQASVDRFQAMFTDAIVQKGRSIAVNLVAKWFAASGIRLSHSEKQAFARFFAGKGETPTIQRKRRPAGAPNVVALTPDDHGEFQKSLRDLMKSGTATIPRLAEDMACTYSERTEAPLAHAGALPAPELSRIPKAAPEEAGETTEQTGFADHGSARVWRSNCCRRAGSRRQYLNLVDVLTRLHARACQVSFEVHTLLVAGLADGAMARCCTLHEIAATAFFVHEHGEQTAERYVLHQTIESWRAARAYNRHAAALHVRRYKKSEMNHFEAERSKLLDRFGKSFDGHYGWAAHILKPKTNEPIRSFADIEESVLPHLQPYYQLESHNVHAKSKGIYHRLGLMDEREVLLAGASDTGLAEPGQNAALFLSQATTVLGLLHVTFETTTMMKLMRQLQCEVGDSFIRAHRQLVRRRAAATHQKQNRSSSSATDPFVRRDVDRMRAMIDSTTSDLEEARPRDLENINRQIERS